MSATQSFFFFSFLLLLRSLSLLSSLLLHFFFSEGGRRAVGGAVMCGRRASAAVGPRGSGAAPRCGRSGDGWRRTERRRAAAGERKSMTVVWPPCAMYVDAVDVAVVGNGGLHSGLPEDVLTAAGTLAISACCRLYLPTAKQRRNAPTHTSGS